MRTARAAGHAHGAKHADLAPSRFLRIHCAHVVNLDFVHAFRRGARGQLFAEMLDGTRLPVSRSKAQQLRHLAV